MKNCIHALLIVLSFALWSPGQGLADGGGGSTTLNVDPAFAKAQIAIKDKDWSKAIDLLSVAVARDDRNADVHNLLGYSERKRGNLDTAFKHYERALALDPDHRGAHEYIGEAYLMIGKLPEAE